MASNIIEEVVSEYSSERGFDGLDAKTLKVKEMTKEEYLANQKRLEMERLRAMDSSLQELVIAEDPLAEKVLFDQKLREIGVIPEEAEIDDGYEKESFHAGFDRRDKPEDQPKTMINGVEASLFDFDALQDNLNFQDDGIQESAREKLKISKKAKELINERKSIRQKVLDAQSKKEKDKLDREMRFQQELALRRAGIKNQSDIVTQPLTNVGSVDFIAKKYVKKKKEKTVVEIKKLQEKYLNPEEKKGKPRSHVGNLQYQSQTIGDIYDTTKLGKLAAQMGMEEIEKKVHEELKVPENLISDIELLLNDPNAPSEKMKREMDLRSDQIKLRKMLKQLNDHLSTILTQQINREEKESINQTMAKARLANVSHIKKRFSQFKAETPQDIALKKFAVLNKQVENSQKIEEQMENIAFELQSKIKRITEVPNLQEMLELGLQKLDEEIHQMQVDKNKLQITEKSYKRQEFLRSNEEYEKRIIALENYLSINYDKIYHLEIQFAKKVGSNMDKRDESISNVGSNFASHNKAYEQTRQKLIKMQQKYAELQMESRLLDQEENTIIYASDEEPPKEPLPETNKLTKKQINQCKKIQEKIQAYQTQQIASNKISLIREKQFMQKELLLQRQIQDQNYKLTQKNKSLMVQQQYIGDLFGKLGVYIDFKPENKKNKDLRVETNLNVPKILSLSPQPKSNEFLDQFPPVQMNRSMKLFPRQTLKDSSPVVGPSKVPLLPLKLHQINEPKSHTIQPQSNTQSFPSNLNNLIDNRERSASPSKMLTAQPYFKRLKVEKSEIKPEPKPRIKIKQSSMYVKDNDPKILELRKKLGQRQVVLEQPQVSNLAVMGIKENKYSKKPRSFLLSTPQNKPANYRGIPDLSFGTMNPSMSMKKIPNLKGKPI